MHIRQRVVGLGNMHAVEADVVTDNLDSGPGSKGILTCQMIASFFDIAI